MIEEFKDGLRDLKNILNEIKKLEPLREQEINKIEGLNEKIELLDHLLERETKVSKSLTELEYEKIETLHNIIVLESKLIKLEISPERIDRIKNSVL